MLVAAGPGGPDAPPGGPAYAAVKRAADVAVAAALLVLAAPLVLLAAVAVKLSSRGPAFYTQVRLGRGGVPFRILKVRTMGHDCERHTGAVWATRGDPRVFPVGRVLRATHVDELPQLVNVLRGDMSLVGPRPERPGITEQLRGAIPGFPDRLAVRPGLTGLAQVQFPADTDLGSVCRKLVADLRYVEAVGPGLDLRVLVATVLYLLRLPVGWRRRALGPYAEPLPAGDRPGSLARLGAAFDLPQKPGRDPAVQGLRGAAASLVFLAHFLTLFGKHLGPAAEGLAFRAADAVSRHGTDLFLLVSGYLIYGLCVRRPVAYGPFLRDRARRIYPAFLCVFGVYLGLSALVPAESKLPAAPAAAAAYLAENLLLLPGLTGTPPLITVTWTLGYELLLYLALPLAVRCSGMRAWSAGRRVVALGAAWAAYLVYCGVVSPAHVRLGVYFAGFLAYEVAAGRGRSGGWPAALTAAAGVGLVVLLRTGVLAVGDPGLAVVVRAVATGAAAFGVAGAGFGPGAAVGPLLSRLALRRLGNASYSFYLTHGLVLKAAAVAAATAAPAWLCGPGLFWLALPICYVAALAVAAVLFLAVERPLSFPGRAPRPREDVGPDRADDTVVLATGTARHPSSLTRR